MSTQGNRNSNLYRVFTFDANNNPTGLTISGAPSWTDLLNGWTTKPVKEATPATSPVAGKVYAYPTKYSGQVINGVTLGATIYRLIPTTYASTNDTFFNTFSGGVLSNPILTRGS